MVAFRLAFLALILASLIPTSASAQSRTVYDSAGQWIRLGGGMPRTFEYPIPAKPGELVVLTIFHGADDSGDHGVLWRMKDGQGNKISEGFTDKEGAAAWKVRVSGSDPYLIIEDKDTLDKGKAPGNGIKVRIDVTK